MIRHNSIRFSTVCYFIDNYWFVTKCLIYDATIFSRSKFHELGQNAYNKRCSHLQMKWDLKIAQNSRFHVHAKLTNKIVDRYKSSDGSCSIT